MKKLVLPLTIALVRSAAAQTPIPPKNEDIGITTSSYFMADDLVQVNSTRKPAGASALKANPYLDSCALVRCLRLAKFVKDNPDKYITTSLVFAKEGHNNMFKWGSENVATTFNTAGLPKETIAKIKESDIPHLVTKGPNGLFLAGEAYNKPERNLKNRIKAIWQPYGSYYLVIFIDAKNYNPEEMLACIPTRIPLHYEGFR